MEYHHNLSARLFQPKTCVLVSIFANLALAAFKFFAGILGLSQAMVADALHSLSDILTSVVAYIGICIGERPPDEEHPYGHGNAETIAAGLVALAVLGIGFWAGVSAIHTLILRQFRQPLGIAIVAALVSILAKELLFRYTRRVGKISNNPAVEADAWHHRSDAYSSVAALFGILGAKVSFLYLDPLAGVVVSCLILNIGLRLIRSNIGIMMDERPKPQLIHMISSLVQTVSGVQKIDSIKVHRRGSTFTIDIEVAVDSAISVKQGHRISVSVRQALLKQIKQVRDVMVHLNPYDEKGAFDARGN